jgi:dienelactone hydrolase
MIWTTGVQGREDKAVAHARHILDLLQAEKFDEVTKEFNAQMAGALPAARLKEAWTALQHQAGAFAAVIDARLGEPVAGATVVIVRCRFEKGPINAIVAFDAESRVAGLHFVPGELPAETTAAPPPSSRFKEQAVTVGTGEWALAGTLSMPPGRNLPGVVLVHGSGPNDRDETIGPNKPFRDIAWGLAERGIAVLRYDKRTRVHGARMATLPNMTVREETLEDAHLATALLRSREEVDPRRVFVLGHSLGGMLAPRIAAEDRALAGIIIMAGATRPVEDVAREQLAYLASLSPGSVNPEEGLRELLSKAPESYWKDLNAYKPADAAAKLIIPILILHGDRDYQVTQADLQGWQDALGDHRNVTIRRYPALNHLFMAGEGKSAPAEYGRPGHVAEAVLDDIAGWIAKVK